MNVSHEPPASFETQLQLNGLGKDQAALLDLISDIQGDGTAGIELPQIIVVGGQSAGKSSTLEAITGLPFPKKAEACTRFATEIRLKHASVEGFAAEIIPDKGRSPEQQAELRKFGKGNRAYNKNTPAATVFEDAHAAIVTPSAPFVLRDKLVVTLAGPNRGHLTLVDLPGLFVNYADGQRSSDIPAIQALVDEYMTNNRSVILAVIAGDEDLGGATIMNLVRKHDPDGLRTIGVVTKPDAATYKELHHRVVQLVQNEIEGNKLRLGWHVVLNPKQSESWTSPEQRSAEEDIFFATNPWSQLRYAQTRIGELRKKLGQHLAAHIANNIPEMRVQIQERVDVAESILNSLGDGTDDRDEMRVDLIRRINASKEVSSNAVNGMYSYFDKAGKQFFPRETPTNNVGEGATTPWENLRARVVCENELFSDDLRLQGHGLPFVSETSTLMTQEPAVITEMEGKKRDYAQRFVKLKIRDLRGTHKPGEISHQVSYHLLNEHATKWEQMSKTHLSKVLIICNQFVGKVLEKLWLPHMRGPLKEQFLDARMDDYRKQAFEHLQYLIGDIGYEVQPYDPEYERRVEEWERKRRPGSWGENSDFDSREYNAELVLERALVLYDINAKCFIRNVIVQVVERVLMNRLRNLFDSEEVVTAKQMSEDVVILIVAEDEDTIALRRHQKQEVEKLRKVLKQMERISIEYNLPQRPADVKSYKNTNRARTAVRRKAAPNIHTAKQTPRHETPQSTEQRIHPGTQTETLLGSRQRSLSTSTTQQDEPMVISELNSGFQPPPRSTPTAPETPRQQPQQQARPGSSQSGLSYDHQRYSHESARLPTSSLEYQRNGAPVTPQHDYQQAAQIYRTPSGTYPPSSQRRG